MKKTRSSSAILGAAFLMATSAVGPGFLTQTTVFTQQLLSSFGFVILISILLDLGAQLNIWRIISASGSRAQDLANDLLPGMGYLLAFLIVFGGLAFNIANIAGAAQGAQILTGWSLPASALVCAAIAMGIFMMKRAGNAMDGFTKILGLVMILLTIYIVFASQPPLGRALVHSFIPEKTDITVIITLVGGTVGGYISFAGAHRLLDAGISGTHTLPQVNRGAVRGILLTSLIRVLLFLATLGVISSGATINPESPPASVFSFAGGNFGYLLFGVMIWSAAITSVVGAAYTSVSFIQSFHPFIEKNIRWCIILFIGLSTGIFLWVGKPVKLLLLAGLVNGLILPIALAIILLVAEKKSLMKAYRHPLLLKIAGWLVVLIMGIMGIKTLITDWGKLWN